MSSPSSFSSSTASEDAADSISAELGRFIESKSSTFTCGGSIDNVAVAVRWDSVAGGQKTVFPAAHLDLEKLAAECQPATFGFKGKDVLDESYRKATKMDHSAFSSNFCPYKLGIISTIAQVLLPNATSGINTNGIRAELYKLNLYSAPTGFFKPHVDTPRSDTQFGSLVVSLPCHHEGGQLIIRHAGHSATYDWGASKVDAKAIHWAAFYSDCEHEVSKVTEGHRVTLKYNLHHAPAVGDFAGCDPIMNIEQLPLYHKVKEALANPEFLTEWSAGCLKGADMAVYAVFKAHGLNIRVQAVLDDKKIIEDPWFEECHTDTPFNRLASVGEVFVTEFGGGDNDGIQDIMDAWTEETSEDGAEENAKKITWLNNPNSKLKSLGYVHMTYGNEAGLGKMYTFAVMTVTIPPAYERCKEMAPMV